MTDGKIKREMFNYRPVVLAALALAAGIVLGAVLRNILWAAVVLAALSGVAAVIAFIRKARVSRVMFTALFAGITAISVYLAATLVTGTGGFAFVTGQVMAEGQYGSSKYTLKDVFIDGEEAGANMYLTTESELETGDVVSFAADVSVYDPNIFDSYDSVYFKNNIRYEAECEEVTVDSSGRLTVFERLDKRLGEVLNEFSGEQAGGVLKGLIVGDTSGIDRDTTEAIRTAGLQHILSVSGLHVGFLCSMIYAFFRLIGRPPKKALKVLAVVLPVYGAMTGFPAGVLRAGITALVFLWAQSSGRRFDALNALSLSAIIILAVCPWELFELGFQMSFAAMLGIVLFVAPIKRALGGGGKISRALSSAVSVSVAANIVLLGLVVSVFGTFAIYFLPANLIAVPYVSVIYSLAVPIAFLSLFIPFMGYLLIPLGYLTDGFILFSEAVAALPGATASMEMPFIGAALWAFGWIFASGINLADKRLRYGVLAFIAAVFVVLLFV